ncbi:hypothetical protein [Sorangium cellulosum]|uniref:hypothetical protein n=1 Tax=Sorangium cellulosum TaxID=56 RepID=UPI003B8A9327
MPNPGDRTTIVFARYAYDGRGDLVRYTDADGLSIHYVYDDDHRIVRYSYDSGLTFHFHYDAAGRCFETWGDYGGAPDPALAPRGLPERLRDGETKVRGIFHVKLEFGEHGYSERHDSVRFQRFFANEDGDVTTAVGAGVTSRVIDDDGAERSHTDPLGGTSTFAYNWRGSLIQETDPLGRVFTIERDANDLVVRNIDFAGGVRECVRDERGTSHFLWGGFRWPCGVRLPNGDEVRSYYNHEGWVVARQNERGEVETYERDASGNLVGIVAFDGSAWRMGYDPMGRLLWQKSSALERFDVTRDAAGRETQIALSDDTEVRVEYDLLDRISAVEGPGYPGYQETRRSDDAFWGSMRQALSSGRGCWTVPASTRPGPCGPPLPFCASKASTRTRSPGACTPRSRRRITSRS